MAMWFIARLRFFTLASLSIREIIRKKFKFKRVDAMLNNLLTTVLVYSYDTTGDSLSLKQTGILSVTDVDRSRARRLMASTALFKNLIFIKIFLLLQGNITSQRSKQPVIGNVEDDGYHWL